MIKKEKRQIEDLIEILKTVLKEDAPDKISGHDRLREHLGLNSFHFMAMIFLIEDEWDIKLEQEKMTRISTVRDLFDLLCEAGTDAKVQ